MNGSILKIPLMFSSVRLIDPEDWPANFLYDSRPGDVLLQHGDHGKRGGFLCLKRQGSVFVSLTPNQVYGAAVILWPDTHDPYLKSIQIEGFSVKVNRVT